MTTTCPRCRLISPGVAARCDCGWDFNDQRMAEGGHTTPRGSASGSAAILVMSAVVALAGPAIPESHLPIGFIMGSLLLGEVGHGGFWLWFLGPPSWPRWIAWLGYTGVVFLGITLLRGGSRR